MIPAIIIVTLLVAYVIGIFVYDGKRRRQGKPSIFLEVCDCEGHGRRLLKDFRKKYPQKER